MTRETTLQDILRKIKALRARAADAASSETEAAMAAKKADELLERHNIDLSELDVRADGIVRERWDSGQETCPVATWAMTGIEQGCHVESWYSGGIISVVGSPADVATALYYIDLVNAAVRNCWATYQRSDDFWRQRERGLSARKIGFSFRKGVASRLGERIGAFAKEPERAASNSTALVPVKNAMIKTWMAENNVKIGSAKSSPITGTAFDAGKRAGDKVGLGRGIATSRPVGLIEAK